MDISQLRNDYRRQSLEDVDADGDALVQFRRWFDEALAAAVNEPSAMTLATADAEGRPSARVVLLKGLVDGLFTFYSNYESRKGRELRASPRAALVFFWPELERQVRVEGRVAPLSDAASDAYFRTRPRGSQLGAWASRQSEVVASKLAAYARLATLAARYALGEVPRPPHWGGYGLAPSALEFWQGRPNRFHDRLRYTREADGAWRRERLWP